MLTLRESFLGREDPGLTSQLLHKLPGVLIWALEGLERLDTGTLHGASIVVRRHHHAQGDLVSPVAAFVRERCVVGAQTQVAVSDLFEAWRKWGDDNGHEPMKPSLRAQSPSAAIPGVRTVRPQMNGERHPDISGHLAWSG